MAVPYFAYGAIGLKDQSSSLDNIPTNLLSSDDICVVLDDNEIYFFQLISDSGKEENSPYVIKPKDESSDKRWELISQKYYNSDLIQLTENFIQTSHIKALDDETIEIESSNGDKIVINKDGTVEFPSTVSGSYPQESDDFTTKQYVDDEYDNLGSQLESNVENELVSYIDDEISLLDDDLTNYIDDEISLLDDDLTNYIDDEVTSTETDLKDYNDSEINRVVEQLYPVLLFELTTWTPSGDIFLNDIQHEKGYNELIIRCWQDDEEIFPYKIESIDENTTRIWNTEEENITVAIL